MGTEIEKATTGVAELARVIANATSMIDLREVRARIEAARAWAKVHKKAKEVRLELLRVEIAALVRIAELDCLGELPKGERAAAEFFASLSSEELASYLGEHAGTTTASGLHRAVLKAQRLEEELNEARQRGRRYASTPPETNSPGWLADAVPSIGRVLSGMVDMYSETGVEFSVTDMADELLADHGFEPSAVDRAFREGVVEVCRGAIRRAEVPSINGTILPKFITAKGADGRYTRIPTMNARLGHLDDMREMRREQLAQDIKALERLDEAAEKLWAVGGAHSDSLIHELALGVASSAA